MLFQSLVARFFGLILVVAAVTTCGDHSDKNPNTEPTHPARSDAPAPAPPAPPAPPSPALGDSSGLTNSLASMQGTLVANRCLGCHQTATAKNRYVDLHDLTSLYTDEAPNDAPGVARKVIRRGCPNESLFYSEINSGEMPPRPAHPIIESDKKIISDWILSLAPQGGVVHCSDEPSGVLRARR